MSTASVLPADRTSVERGNAGASSRSEGHGGLTILHIGLGSFHRAHQAVYLHHLREAGDRTWSIVSGNIRPDPADATAALAAQRGEYTLETVSPAGERRYERIRSIAEVIPYDPASSRLLDVGAQPATRIVSFTITEAGHYLGRNERVDLAHPDVAADLDGATGTIYGLIAAMLRLRIRRGGGAVTLLSCDNLRGNGKVFRDGLLDFLRHGREDELIAWVEASTSCPSTMVDRITPRPALDLPARVKRATGWDDLAPVMSESFRQWAVEDRFIAGRPAWERVGVEMVASVHDHEETKIRILNASHSCIAWAGTLLGLDFIHQAVAVPEIREMARRYITADAIPCLEAASRSSPIPLFAYRDGVLERFGNPVVRDTNERVAADSYSKIPAFVMPTLRERVAQDLPIDGTAALAALFFAFLSRWHAGQLPFAYQDKLMTGAAAHELFSSSDPLLAYCGDASLWSDLAGNPVLVRAARAAHGRVEALLSQARARAAWRSA